MTYISFNSNKRKYKISSRNFCKYVRIKLEQSKRRELSVKEYQALDKKAREIHDLLLAETYTSRDDEDFAFLLAKEVEMIIFSMNNVLD